MQQPQNPFQQTSPQFQRPQNVVRESASNYQSNVKKPSPFDFANQSGAGGATSAPQQTDGGRLRYHGLVFSGGVGEYYGVVILNYLLTLITLGIYAPWAKVRKERYFHSHTEFLDEGFQYLATGKQLLAGRAVAFVLLIALSMAELIPYVGVAISILFVLVALPFILNRSVRFKARNVAWRDVRFGWHGGLGMAILVWMIYPVLSFVTLGLAQPLAARALRRHYADNHAFGGASFSADLGLGAFYAALGKAVFFALFLLALFGGIGGFIAYSLLGDMLVSVSSYEELVLILAILPDEQKAYLALPFIGIAFALFMSGQYYFALVRHVMVNHLRLQGGIRFRSQLSGFKFAMLMLSNLLINIISLGFAHPYTIIRRYRYLVQAIEIRPIADMAGFVDTQTKAGFSVFEEASDIEGLSIDI
ncbi:MAG: YjgN family protein [Candidatus Puniceispirillaceae bacterium]